jgi:hypothetical protein
MIVLAFAACGGERQIVTAPSSPAPLSAAPAWFNIFIRGHVLDFRTQAGVPGAVVQFVEWTDERIKIVATTDASGSYTMTVPNQDQFFVLVGGVGLGSALVTGPAYRGDLFVNGGPCISRYGAITDARTLRPVAGATVSLAPTLTTRSGPDGWYRLDLGCPSENYGGGTTFMYITHPNYAPRQTVVGRGVYGVERVDLDLQPR